MFALERWSWMQPHFFKERWGGSCVKNTLEQQHKFKWYIKRLEIHKCVFWGTERAVGKSESKAPCQHAQNNQFTLLSYNMHVTWGMNGTIISDIDANEGSHSTTEERSDRVSVSVFPWCYPHHKGVKSHLKKKGRQKSCSKNQFIIIQ